MNSGTRVDVQRPETLGYGCCFIQGTGKPTSTEKSLQGAHSRIEVKINFSWKPFHGSPRGGAWRLFWGWFGAAPPWEPMGAFGKDTLGCLQRAGAAPSSYVDNLALNMTVGALRPGRDTLNWWIPNCGIWDMQKCWFAEAEMRAQIYCVS